MLVVLGLGDAEGFGKVIVGKCGIDNLVAMLGQVGRLDAAWHRPPAVEEKDFHSSIVALGEGHALVPV